MEKIIDTHFWNPALRFKEPMTYTYTPINETYKLRTPVLTKQNLSLILTSIKQQREHYLLNADIPTILDTIGQVTEQWLDPFYKGRILARDILPSITGFSREMIETWGFGRFLSIIKKENLPLMNKVKHDDYQSFSAYGDGLVKAYGTQHIFHSNFNPALIGHICAGNILGIGAFEIIMDKLVDAATWVKPSSEEPVFTALYAKSIEEIDPQLAYTIAVIPFDSKNDGVNHILFSQSDLIRATGGEIARRNLTSLAERYKKPIAGHWHKLSFIAIAREYLNKHARSIAELVSLDVSAWDQQGCFSPQEIFLERGGDITPLEFTQLLAEEMEVTATHLPKGLRSGKIEILNTYYKYFKKQLMGQPIQIFQSPTKKWLLIYEEKPKGIEPSPLFRVIRLRPVDDLADVAGIIKPLSTYLQTAGVAIPNHRLLEFANKVGEAGVTNIRTISSMTLQKPWEPWDGRFPLQELFEHDSLRWVSISTRDIESEIQAFLKQKRALFTT